MADSPLSLIEFPADDPERARAFWSGVLGIDLQPRGEEEGEGWQTRSRGTDFGLHERGKGPGDKVPLPYFEVEFLPAALAQVEALGGSIVHPGERWAICKDSEGSPFGLSARGAAPAAD